MNILRHVIRFLIVLICFPLIWVIFGIFAYIRVIFTHDKLEISFTKYYEEFNPQDIKDYDE